MSIENREKATGEDSMERRLIRIDNLPDQAGIAAALRSAFADGPVPVLREELDPFAALLKQIH